MGSKDEEIRMVRREGGKVQRTNILCSRAVTVGFPVTHSPTRCRLSCLVRTGTKTFLTHTVSFPHLVLPQHQEFPRHVVIAL